MGNEIDIIMDNYLKKIKISFSVCILLLIIGIAGGGFMMKDNNFFNGKQFSQIISYLNYKLFFARANGENLTAAVISIFNYNAPVFEINKSGKSVPVLLYHGIIEKSDGANVLLENFKNQMFALKKAGWQTISIEDFYAFMQGKKELPDKSFLLTFDDGRKDSYYPVDPILKALDYRAVIFIITKHSIGDESGDRYYLSNSELEMMTKSGRWDIQAHTKNGHDFIKIDDKGGEGHFYSNKLYLKDKNRLETDGEFKKRIADDFAKAKEDLEKSLGRSVIAFAYPFGDFGQNSINFPEAKSVVSDMIKLIYPMSFYQVWGGNPKTNYSQPDSEHLFIKRTEVEPQWSANDLLTVLEKSLDKKLSHRDTLMKDNGCQKDWGSIDFKDGSMVIGANASTTGSAVFLDGTYLWQNYVFKADIRLIKGQVFSLTARYKDGKNYVACLFSDKSIKIEQVLNGEKKVLSELAGDFVFLGKNREVGIGVYDDVINCYLDGEIAIKGYNLDQGLNHGGIGFKTWDPQVNNSELIVKSVSVEEIK